MVYDVVIEVEHPLGRDEALRRAQVILPELQSKYADQIEIHEVVWSDTRCAFSFTTNSVRISGWIIVNADNVKIVSNLPRGVSMLFPSLVRKFTELVEEETKEIFAG